MKREKILWVYINNIKRLEKYNTMRYIIYIIYDKCSEELLYITNEIFDNMAYIPYNYKGKYVKIILTNGFVKKTRKTPMKQIKLAKQRRADFKERMSE